jgi:hypothetical protein
MLAGALSTAAVAKKNPARKVVYEGLLEDGKQKPIGGVFALSFSFHKRPKGGKSLWTESHFVAVDHGRYVVELGAARPIPGHLKLEELFLGVSLTGGAEIIRERLAPSAVQEDGAQASAPLAIPADSRSGSRGSVVDYAETAGMAYQAEHAKVADRLGSLTEDELYERLKGTTGKARVASHKRFTALAGGDGGVPYELKCPKGHVVTGVRGGEGIYLDSVQLICSALE